MRVSQRAKRSAQLRWRERQQPFSRCWGRESARRGRTARGLRAGKKYFVWKSSGRQTTCAPRPAASAIRVIAFSRFCSGSGPHDICTSATRNFSGGTCSKPPRFNIALQEISFICSELVLRRVVTTEQQALRIGCYRTSCAQRLVAAEFSIDRPESLAGLISQLLGLFVQFSATLRPIVRPNTKKLFQQTTCPRNRCTIAPLSRCIRKKNVGTNTTRQEQRNYVTAQSKGETVIRRLSTFLLTIAAFVSVMSAVGLAQSQTLMTRHTREEVIGKVAPLVGHLSATQNLRLVLVLPHRNQPELDQFLKDLYDPSNPSCATS